MSYLARLKAEISEKRSPSELTELTKGASVSFVSTEGSHFSEVDRADEDPERAAIIEHDGGYPGAVAAWAATPGPPARPRPSSGLPPPRIKIPYFFATIAH